jgi:hypothetical protein
MTRPVVTEHAGILVVRDDLFPGGTKARFAPLLFKRADEVVYASPAEGGAQTALAHAARACGKRATIVVARRAHRHPRTREAAALGAKIIEVAPGYLSVVQKRARDYCRETGALLAPFGMAMPEAVEVIAAAARSTGLRPDEVWCAAGSGVLMRALTMAWPDARRFAVQVGRELHRSEVMDAEIIAYPMPFGAVAPAAPPFPSDPHYDAKAWLRCRAQRGAGQVVFWNVAGPAAG